MRPDRLDHWEIDVKAIATEAGAAILEVYEQDFDVVSKADDSPLTQADLASHRVITEALARLTPDIPLLSEESADIPFTERGRWGEYWLIDPESRSITVFKLDSSAALYSVHGMFETGDEAASATLPGFRLDVTALFAQDA